MGRVTTESWVKRALEVHGNVFDYSNTVYVNNKTKVKIVCPKHGEFSVNPDTHIRKKSACRQCMKENRPKLIRKTTEDFIEDSKNRFGSNAFDYSKSIYQEVHKPIILICKIHGEIETTPNKHLKTGNVFGCIQCNKEHYRKKVTRTFKEFTKQAQKVHELKYTYDESSYKNGNELIAITCKVHGKFMQIGSKHLKGHGCPDCAHETRNLNNALTTKEFISKAKSIHNNFYTYLNTVYVRTSEKVTITCPTHGDFEQQASVHLLGSGCPSCMITGFNKSKPGYLYYLKIVTEDGQVLYKVGITNRTISQRFSLTDLSKIEIVNKKLYQNGADAYAKEQSMLKKYEAVRYKGPKILSSGNTELFTEDVLSLEDL